MSDLQSGNGSKALLNSMTMNNEWDALALDNTPEQRLIVALLIRAFLDYAAWSLYLKHNKGYVENIARGEARGKLGQLKKWFLSDSDKPFRFRWCVEHLNFEDPEGVIKAMRENLDGWECKAAKFLISTRYIFNSCATNFGVVYSK
jgi:hypothetical protein